MNRRVLEAMRMRDKEKFIRIKVDNSEFILSTGPMICLLDALSKRDPELKAQVKKWLDGKIGGCCAAL